MNRGTVSVFIPSYNHSLYIKDTLEAVFNQTYQPLELIVIDDGSSDNSPEIIKKALAECPFESRLIVRPNKGLPATINEGLELSRGEFFAVIASDDIWLPNFLSRRVSQLQKQPNAVLAYGNCFSIDENNQITGSTLDWKESDKKFESNSLFVQEYPVTPTILYRRSILNIQKWNPDTFVEDFELHLRLRLLGEFAFDPEVLSGYRGHSTNMSNNTELLLNGKIQAYELNAEALNLSTEKISEIKTKLEWELIDGYIQSGQRLRAVKTAFRCSDAKVSTSMKIRQYIKLLLPNLLVEAGRRRIKRNSDKWFGMNIKSLMSNQN